MFSFSSSPSSSSSIMSAHDLGIWLNSLGSYIVLLAQSYLAAVRSSFFTLFRDSSRPSDNRFAFLDIFRFVALCWVIINHLGSEGRFDILRREPSGEQFKQAIHEHIIFGPLLGNSALGVEIFLLLSGLLAAYSWQRHWKSEFTFWGNTISFLTRRWLRLALPVLAFIFIAISPLSKWAMPQFYLSMASSCTNEKLLSHALFLNNWQTFPTCFGWLWYLGLDWQCYLIAPFLLHFLNKMPKVGTALIGILLFGSTLLRGWHCRLHGICNKSDVDIPFVSFPDHLLDPVNSTQYSALFALYARPATKLGPFLIGILIGLAIIHKKIPQFEELKSRRLFAVGFSSSLPIIYGILPEYWNPDQGNTIYNTLYTATFRNAFAASIGLMVLSQLGRRNRSISPIWAILARLTFSAFLVHMPVVFLFNHLTSFQRTNTIYGLLLIYPFALILTLFSALIFHCFVESPLSRLFSFH